MTCMLTVGASIGPTGVPHVGMHILMKANKKKQIHLEVDSSSHSLRNAGDSTTKPVVLPRLLIAAEVAAAVRKSEKTIYKWAKQGRIPSVINIDGNVLFDAEGTRQWIDDHRMAA